MIWFKNEISQKYCSDISQALPTMLCKQYQDKQQPQTLDSRFWLHIDYSSQTHKQHVDSSTVHRTVCIHGWTVFASSPSSSCFGRVAAKSWSIIETLQVKQDRGDFALFIPHTKSLFSADTQRTLLPHSARPPPLSAWTLIALPVSKPGSLQSDIRANCLWFIFMFQSTIIFYSYIFPCQLKGQCSRSYSKKAQGKKCITVVTRRRYHAELSHIVTQPSAALPGALTQRWFTNGHLFTSNI